MSRFCCDCDESECRCVCVCVCVCRVRFLSAWPFHHKFSTFHPNALRFVQIAEGDALAARRKDYWTYNEPAELRAKGVCARYCNFEAHVKHAPCVPHPVRVYEKVVGVYNPKAADMTFFLIGFRISVFVAIGRLSCQELKNVHAEFISHNRCN